MSPVAVFFLFTHFTLHTIITSEDETLNQEKEALKIFFDEVRHKNLAWNFAEPPCNWKGVCCDPDNITVLYIRLPAKSLLGKIPDNSIGMLSNLRVLSLRINNLSGSIPSDFSNLTTLTRLHLNNNSFTGQLPFIKFKNKLKSFDVSLNKLNTSIPSSLSMFSKAAFSNNVYLCGKPYDENRCNNSYPDPNKGMEETEKKNSTGKIVGISVGSGVLLLLLLCCVQKELYEESKEATKLPSVASGAASKAGTSTQGGKKELVSVEYGIYVEDLLTTSAEVLGEGGFGISYKQEVKEKTMTVVVKRLKDVVVNDKEFETTMAVLGKKKDKNVVPLRGFYNYLKHEKWLVYDYMTAGSLSAHLHGSKRPRRTQLDWDRRMKIALDAARGLAYLHEPPEKVVHGNIKSSNILLRQETNNEACVSDYGLNTLFGGLSPLNNGYWAPEVPEAQKVTLESDVYSFGVLLLELLTGETPEQATSGKRSKWVESLVREELPKTDEMFDVELTKGHNIEEMVQLWRTAKDCVSFVPDQRPTMQQVVSMMEDMCLRPSSDDYSKGYDFTPSTGTRDTPSSSTITP